MKPVPERRLRFAKLHGAGNDFLLFDGTHHPDLEVMLPEFVARLCGRRQGIGADGVLLVLPTGAARARLVYWNADGSAAEFCANGTRCAARLAAKRWRWREMVLETPYAAIPAVVEGDNVTLHLPPPGVVEPWRTLRVDDEDIRACYIEVGVPHLVVPVAWPDFWDRPLAPLAPALRSHRRLPAGGANVNLAMVGDGNLAVRSWERGVEGETLSCGSGDVAAGLVAIAEGWIAAPARVLTASGRALVVTPEGEPPTCPSRLTGPAEWVASGEVATELLAAP